MARKQVEQVYLEFPVKFVTVTVQHSQIQWAKVWIKISVHELIIYAEIVGVWRGFWSDRHLQSCKIELICNRKERCYTGICTPSESQIKLTFDKLCSMHQNIFFVKYSIHFTEKKVIGSNIIQMTVNKMMKTQKAGKSGNDFGITE